jgi:signal transduction histidine kinase/ligand-binding sensor domain-containing protein/CheY-like chemotaxis protein
MRKGKILIFLVLLVSSKAFTANEEFVFKQIVAANELSQAWVTTIIQDHLGFMWFGTTDGLYRYDGYEFKVYRSMAGDQSTLIGNNISTIFIDKNGFIWIATTKGLCLYNRDRDCFIQKDNWPKIHISDIAEDTKGRLYLGSYVGFYRFTPEKENFEYYIDSYQSSEIYNGNQTFYFTRSGSLLMNGDDGLYRFNEADNMIKPIFHGNNFVGYEMTAITEDHSGNLWIGFRDYGLFYVKKENLSSPIRLNLPANHFLNTGTVLSIIESTDSTLWIGTENNGLVLMNLKKFYHSPQEIVQITGRISDPNTLSNNSIYALHEDVQKNIWIGTYSGLNFYNTANNNFHHQRYIAEDEGSLNNNIVNCFYEYNDQIWIATEKGINILNRKDGSYSYLTHKSNNPNSLSTNAIWALAKDDEDNFWIGTWAGGLNKYNPQNGRFTHFNHIENDPNSISSNNIFSIFIDKSGLLWIGTMGGGLNKYDPKTNKFTNYVHDNNDSSTISNDWVRQVYIDSKNRMWISTYTSLDIFKTTTGTFKHFYYNINNPDGISDIGAISILEDSKKHLWFGTESGLNLFNESDSSFIKYQVRDGLPGNTIHSILEDENGNIWTSTDMGISKFVNGSSLPKSPEFVNFDVRDGLQGNRFNSRSALETKDGCLFFGGKNGFNRFYPDQIAQNKYMPPIVITSLKVSNNEISPANDPSVLNKHISIADHFRLKYKQSVFSISFAALNYLIPEKNQYSYMLEGFEKTWNNVGSNRTATYTNLDPGEYIFKVKACNNSGIWNDPGVSLRITILPPWYRTIWAYLLYMMIIAGIVLLYRRLVIQRTQLQHQLELKNLEKEKLNQISQIKTRFFTNISHEFRTPLSLIISPVENLLSDISLKSKELEQLSIIQKNSRRLLRLINQLMDISKIESDHLKLKVEKADIVQYIGEIISLFRYLATQNKIDFTFKTNRESFICFFDTDKIEKICYNLIANAFKYTPQKGKVSVILEILNEPGEKEFNGHICIRVKDNGIGISKEDQDKIFEQFYRADSNHNNILGSGIGLSLVQGLINVYRGKIKVVSEPEKGSEFIIYLPFEEKYFNSAEISRSDEKPRTVTMDIYDLEQYVEKKDELLQPAGVIDNDEDKTVILIVEDNDELRAHLTDKFSSLYQVYSASNGSEALSMVHTHFPEIIISDIKMPVMDGLELCKRLKSDESTSHIPVILLTAKAGNEDRYEGASVGADAYITKPFDTKVLIATVKNLIETRRQLREKYKRSLVIGPSDIEIASVDEKFIVKAIAVVEKFISDPDFSVDIFSREVGMSRSHLHRKLVGLTGFSPSGFIRTIRMKRAAKLLTKGKLTVSEILFEVGIKSRSYFTKSFKEQFGVVPTEYADNFEEEKTE